MGHIPIIELKKYFHDILVIIYDNIWMISDMIFQQNLLVQFKTNII